MNPRAVRTLRGAIAAAVAIQVALLSHVLGGGATPDVLLLALTFVVAWIVCLSLVGTRLSLARLAVGVALSQFAFHAIFSGLGDPVAGAVVAGHVHSSTAPASMTMTAPIGAASAGPDVLMWLAHALAAAVTTLVLFRGERAVQAILAPLVVLVRAVIIVVLASPSSPRRLVSPALPAVSDLLSRVGVSSANRRGPPPLARSLTI